MEHFEQVVFDEGHKTPEAIGQAMHIELHAHEIESVLGIPFLGGSAASEMTDWKQWAVLARAEAENRIVALRAKMRDSAAAVKQLLHMRNLSKRLATLATARPEHWVCDEMSDGYVFDPVRVGRYGESMLLLGIPSIVIVSATLRPKTMFMIGLGKDHFDYLEFDSDFDPHRCPIYYLPTMRVDHRASSLAPLWIKLDQIAARRTDRKGIVHTISFTRRNEILSVSRFAPAMLVNERGEASTQAIAAFKAAGPGTILVSPSVAEGFDFPGRDCEWQFVAKIPFPDGRAKIVKARQEDDKEWGAYQAFNKLVQIFGRGMRHREDRCESFICDTHLDWFLPKFGHLAPRTFHNFFRRIGSLPPPAPKL
jgi:Rad3-related DNA helicase